MVLGGKPRIPYYMQLPRLLSFMTLALLRRTGCFAEWPPIWVCPMCSHDSSCMFGEGRHRADLSSGMCIISGQTQCYHDWSLVTLTLTTQLRWCWPGFLHYKVLLFFSLLLTYFQGDTLRLWTYLVFSHTHPTNYNRWGMSAGYYCGGLVEVFYFPILPFLLHLLIWSHLYG